MTNRLAINPEIGGGEVIPSSPRAIFLFGLGLLRLAGTPPLLGFYAKVAILIARVGEIPSIYLGTTVLASIYLLYIYVRLFYSCVEGRISRGLVVLRRQMPA